MASTMLGSLALADKRLFKNKIEIVVGKFLLVQISSSNFFPRNRNFCWAKVVGTTFRDFRMKLAALIKLYGASTFHWDLYCLLSPLSLRIYRK